MYNLRVFAFFAVLSAGMIARAGDWPAAADEAADVRIEDSFHTLDGDDKDTLTSLEIVATAPAGGGAGLTIGATTWDETNLTVDTLTMAGAGTGTIFNGDTFPITSTGHAVLLINNGMSLTVRDTMDVGPSSFVAVGYAANGTSDQDGGELEVDSLNLSGVNSEIWVSGDGLLAAETVDMTAGRLRVEGEMTGGGNFTMAGPYSVVDISGTMSDYALVDVRAGSAFNVAAGGTLSGADDGDSEFTSAGDVTIDGSMTNFGTIDVTGGTFTVGGTLAGSGDSVFTQSGGTVSVDGVMDAGFDAVSVDNGNFAIGDNGAVNSMITHTLGTVTVDGGYAAGGITTGGGSVTLSGADAHVGTLITDFDADVRVIGTATVDQLVMRDGSMTVGAGGRLTVNGGGTFAGDWNILGGGNVDINNTPVVTFAGGSINVGAGGGRIGMNEAGGELRIESEFNAAGSLTIAMNGGNFALNGLYSVDYRPGGTAPLVTVTGNGTLEIDPHMKVTLDSDAHAAFNNLAPGGEGLHILDTDATAPIGIGNNGDPLFYNSGAARYTYVVKDVGDGYGLYVTAIELFGREERIGNLINSWNQHPRVDGNADNLINNSFANAVIDGFDLAGGFVEDNGLLDDPSARFNAGALAGIMEYDPAVPGGAGYDALMLYNGAGLTAANDAALNMNRYFLRRVGDRAGIIRREVIVDELDQPETINEAEDPNRRLYGDPAATRLWADVLAYSDSAGGKGGFAGYDYSGRGLMIGADKREDDIWYGAALAYVSGTFEDKAASSGDGGIDAYALFAHAGWQDESGLYLTGTLGYSYADNTLRDTRTLGGVRGTNEADFGTHSFLIATEAGLDIPLGENLIVTPAMGLEYAASRGGAHQQWFTGVDGDGKPVGARTLEADTITGSSLSVPLGIAASMDVYGDGDSLLSITGKAGYAYELQNRGARGMLNYGGLGGVIAPVDAAGREPGRHSWNLGLSARYLFDNVELGLGYEYLGRDNSASHSVTFSAGMNF